MSLAEKWNFDWNELKAILDGESMIDMSNLKNSSWEDATEFLYQYGYDMENFEHRRKLAAVRIESWNFIQLTLMPKEWKRGLQPPEEVIGAEDVRTIVLLASDQSEDNYENRVWACALLRVMHTITHIDGGNKFAEIEKARSQIIERYSKHLFRNEDQDLCFGTKENFIVIDRVEWKYKKPRHSVIIKLLHKKGNVAETIHDLLGIRIVVKNLYDILMLLKILLENHIVIFANLHPSRTRNNLFQLSDFKNSLELLKNMMNQKHLTETGFYDLLEGMMDAHMPKKKHHSNPHSSNLYRSVQLTCRHLIRLPSFKSNILNSLKGTVEAVENIGEDSSMIRDISFLIENMLWDNGEEETAFYPYELQIVDEKTARINKVGEASHANYKKMQLRSARRRVLGGVLTLRRRQKKI